jgi:hypothetical protein
VAVAAVVVAKKVAAVEAAAAVAAVAVAKKAAVVDAVDEQTVD